MKTTEGSGCDITTDTNKSKESVPLIDITEKKKNDLIGQIFGRLTVISKDFRRWKCLCKCGKTTYVYSQHLKTGDTKSCGCLIKEPRQNITGHHPFQWLYRCITNKAPKKNIMVTLTFDEFLEFTKINKCHYCGCEIEWKRRKTNVQSARYNLDRKDNNIGYTKENCVVCCKECNYAKGKFFTHDEMLIIGKAIGEVKNNRILTK